MRKTFTPLALALALALAAAAPALAADAAAPPVEAVTPVDELAPLFLEPAAEEAPAMTAAVEQPEAEPLFAEEGFSCLVCWSARDCRSYCFPYPDGAVCHQGCCACTM
jgi:hypothetical protein